ncbi:hypothetical protein T492DRAFT_1060585 [Pavlovales sp. CCMP2436]|nr:hypothetical protein T492DRAFT_1060585 [Pavlovales sp. CCMP2436]|mmetsp:Transcript_979/g.2553  ORF Transcript_979/g.2553 Transcript_979/m.2553 type:complete len:226 (+) Transcript_979:54-731(+)
MIRRAVSRACARTTAPPPCSEMLGEPSSSPSAAVALARSVRTRGAFTSAGGGSEVQAAVALAKRCAKSRQGDVRSETEAAAHARSCTSQRPLRTASTRAATCRSDGRATGCQLHAFVRGDALNLVHKLLPSRGGDKVLEDGRPTVRLLEQLLQRAARRHGAGRREVELCARGMDALLRGKREEFAHLGLDGEDEQPGGSGAAVRAHAHLEPRHADDACLGPRELN